VSYRALNIGERLTMLIEARNNIGPGQHPNEPAMGINNGYMVVSMFRELRQNRYQ
jgi:hypothetical protein